VENSRAKNSIKPKQNWVNIDGGKTIMDQEKRKQERVIVHFDVDVMLGEAVIQVQILNISLTGILCTTHPLFRKDTPCKVIISLKDDLKITINSKILRVGDQGAAISFVEMDEESFVHLMWCSTMRVTQAAPREETSSGNPLAGNVEGKLPSENDKALMLRAFGMPPDKCR
jgi:hypothetical protein